MNKKATLVLKKEIEWRVFLEVCSGVLYGLCVDQRILPLYIVHLHTMYQKGLKIYIPFVVLAIVSSFYIGTHIPFVYCLIGLFYIFVMKMYTTLKIQMKPYVIQTMLCMLGCYYLYGLTWQFYQLSAMCLVIAYLFYDKEEYANKEPFFSLLTLAYCFAIVVFKEYILFIQLLYLSICAYYLHLEMMVAISLYFVLLGFDAVYVLALLFIASMPNKILPSFLIWFVLLYKLDIYSVYFCIVCMCMGLICYGSEERFMEESKEIEKEHQLHLQHNFSYQIVQYANIFYNLSYYYEECGDELSEMLKRMGEALEYNAKLSKQYVYAQTKLQTRICEMLKGYKFALLECSVESNKDSLQIQLELERLYENEVKEVIKPLLENICSCSLQLAKCKPIFFQKGKYSVVFESESYAKITTYGNSVHVHEVSGDSYQSFQNDPYAILMLSDGMGKGLKAKKTSSIVLQIIEAMLRCNIPQMECIKMMNLFLRSDIYATLDILSFDRRNKKAYLSKAASAPTYLYRNKQLYEMSAHSLPIGIVDYVSAEVFEIQYQKGDIFIMCSDGVEKEEIEKWMGLRRCTNIKNEGLNLMNILKEKKRKDDSTILMAKID